MIPRLLPLLLAAASACVAAADGDSEQAARLRDDARALRTQAEDRLRAAEPECYKRFLVNRCLADAKEARLETIRKARELEAEASRIELAERWREAAERGADRAGRPEQPAAPSAIDRTEVVPDDAAEATRRAREAQAARDTAAAQARQQAEDADKARERAAAKAEADRRAADARRDRERYDERIRRREQDKREN